MKISLLVFCLIALIPATMRMDKEGECINFAKKHDFEYKSTITNCYVRFNKNAPWHDIYTAKSLYIKKLSGSELR